MSPLTNAQRQARYRKSLKAKAQGVTPAMVQEAAQIIYEFELQEGAPDWEAFLASTRKRGKQGLWSNLWSMPIDEHLLEEMAQAGIDADLVRRVWNVARSVLIPPAS